MEWKDLPIRMEMLVCRLDWHPQSQILVIVSHNVFNRPYHSIGYVRQVVIDSIACVSLDNCEFRL